MPSHRVADVAVLLGVSDDTVRRWIELGQVSSATDSTGLMRIDGASLAHFLIEQRQARPGLEDSSAVQSARNHIQGIITAITSDPVMSQVELISGRSRIVSLISTEAVCELGLQIGSIAVAEVKATNVSIQLPRTR